MPTIEVLPSSSTSSGPNWTYSNLPPALAHRNSLPTANTRVRATRTNNENSAARQRQINSRIVELEADNYRDTHIPVPARKKESSRSRASTRTKASSTQNVRRILASQKTFANHLADAEALTTPATAPQARRSGRASPGSDTEMEGGEREREKEKEKEREEAFWSEDEPGPPLSYAAAAAVPGTRPKRLFCEICGYWGRYRCQRCAARYCGLECGGVHAETRCNKFYA